MTHRRKTIRDAVVTKLSSAVIVGSGKVYSNRLLALPIASLPAINVYATEELAEQVEVPGDETLRTLDLTVEVEVANADDATIDDTLDSYCELIEAAMKADPSLGIQGVDCSLTATALESTAEGEAPTGSASLTYTIRYFT